VAAADSRPADVDAAVEHAGELAQRTGEGNAYGLGFGHANVGLWRMDALLEIGDHERVAVLAEGLNPDVHPHRSRRSAYWADYGRALARCGRHDDAVRAFRRAEVIHPHRVQRDPFAREVLAELLARSRRDAVGRELRRDGLPGWLAGVAQPGDGFSGATAVLVVESRSPCDRREPRLCRA
jgi:hypothetical protein